MYRRRPALRELALAGLAGLVMALGQAPVDAWYATLLALAALMYLAAHRADAAGVAWIMWAGGVGYFGLALSWIVQPFLVDAARDGWMAPFALVLMAAGLSLFWAVAGWAAGRFSPHAARRAVFLAMTLTLVELARGYVATGFPWAMIGHVWLETPVAQLAVYVGPTGLTAIACLIAALPVAAGRIGGVGSVLLLVAAFGAGQARLSQPDPAPRSTTVRLVQPNAEQHLKWDAEQADLIFGRLLDMTAAMPAPDLVIWPETSVPYQFEPEGGVAQAMSDAAQGAVIAAGVQRLEGDLIFNSLAVLGPGGTVTAGYDKSHLVPFGEYVPFGDQAWRWFGLRAFAAQQGFGYSAGPGPTVLDLGPAIGRVQPIICYEAVFPQYLRAAQRPDWILQITNDAWFGTLSGPFQHLAQARLRAIEQGIPLVRVANTGVTGVIDARGRMVDSLPFGTEGFLDAVIPGALAQTPYARWGDWPILVLLIGATLALFGWWSRVKH